MRKRMLTMFAAAMLVVSAAAQGWSKVGTAGVDVAWQYRQAGMGSFTMRSYNEPRFTLASDGGDLIVQADRHKYIIYLGTVVNVEIYDSCKVLNRSFDMWLDYDSISNVFTTRNDAKKIPVTKQGRKVRYIFDALRSGGYVCFYARRPGSFPLDLMVTPRRERK